MLDKIQEYLKSKKQTETLYNEIADTLTKKAIDVLVWEKNNLDTDYDGPERFSDIGYPDCSVELKIFSDGIQIKVYDYHTCAEESYDVAYERLLSEDWKKAAKHKHISLKQQMAEQKRAESLEERRRLYEELKAEFEPATPSMMM